MFYVLVISFIVIIFILDYVHIQNIYYSVLLFPGNMRVLELLSRHSQICAVKELHAFACFCFFFFLNPFEPQVEAGASIKICCMSFL